MDQGPQSREGTTGMFARETLAVAEASASQPLLISRTIREIAESKTIAARAAAFGLIHRQFWVLTAP